ncbi:enolase [Kineococcus sp. R8]|uniref:mandelate racemase/muconate lactonizing enzyme family protein n=1 Tax=Kineococcus siccus TaxID=2696567 RepID=UPI001411EED5|nr:enolase C-terminal domain-like protein [Kineococcus siccus]NAZ80408.1 enolase [Kineococcus siccus]
MRTDVRVTRVDAVPFSIPYRKPLRFASGEVHAADHVLVRVHTDAGVVGIAEAPPRPFTYGETQASIVAVVDQLLGPALVGRSLHDRNALRAAMHRTVGNPTAKAAVDMAVWDALGRCLGLTVTAMLGGGAGRPLRVCHMLGFDDPAVMVAEAGRMLADHGVDTFKVKVGRRPLELDVAVVRALRAEFGPGIDLYVDGNRGWTASESLRALRLMEDLDLSFAEELCPADDVLDRRRLVRRSTIPVLADESATTPAEVTRELLSGAADAVSIKTARTGFTVSRVVLDLCDGLGVEVVVGNQVDGQLGTSCSAAFAAAHPLTAARAAELSNFLDMSDDLLTESLRIEQGHLVLPVGPGVGVVVDEEKLEHYRRDR